MKSRVVVSAAALWLAALGGPAWAASSRDQSTPTPTATATPTATPTSTPTPAPGAKALLAASKRADNKANTFHISLTEQFDIVSLAAGTLNAAGDVKLKQHSERVHVTGTLRLLGKPENLNEEDIVIGNQQWTKSAKTHLRWRKGGSTSGMSNVNFFSVTTAGKTRDVSVTDGGTLSGAPVWHIHGIVVVKVDSTHTTNGTFDYFIGQRDKLLYRFRENVDAPSKGLLLDLTAAFSRYGEQVNITAPKVGSTKL